MIRLIRRAAILPCALALAACGSAPVHFYTLVPSASGAVSAPATRAPFLIDVLPVGVPAQVDQPQLVVRQGDGSVALLEGEQWIAPLADEIRSAVAGELVRRLGVQDVHGLPQATTGTPLYRIKLDVRRFDSVPAQYALVQAAWSVRATGDARGLECTADVRESVGPGYEALVRGHQRALTALADQMALAVRQLAGAGVARCP
jgi:uncharacterized lipoprotein YmbA